MDVVFAEPRPRSEQTRTPLHIESDFYMDVDDIGALAMALNLEADGIVDIVGFGINAPNHWGVHNAALIGWVYGRDLPLGRRPGPSFERRPGDYDNARQLSELYCEVAEPEAPEGVRLLRKVLADADRTGAKVTIASIGYLRNLVDLLRSGPDDLSDLDGPELIRRGVAQILVMAGTIPHGTEHNLAWDAAESIFLLDEWPGPIDFIGFETADRVFTARGLTAVLGPDSPVARAYAVYGCEESGRPSWDPLTIYVAAFPESERYSWSEPGEMKVAPDGSNTWEFSPDGRHRHLLVHAEPDALALELDSYIRRPPAVDPDRASAVRQLSAGS